MLDWPGHSDFMSEWYGLWNNFKSSNSLSQPLLNRHYSDYKYYTKVCTHMYVLNLTLLPISFHSLTTATVSSWVHLILSTNLSRKFRTLLQDLFSWHPVTTVHGSSVLHVHRCTCSSVYLFSLLLFFRHNLHNDLSTHLLGYLHADPPENIFTGLPSCFSFV